jgi:hypothetical protein
MPPAGFRRLRFPLRGRPARPPDRALPRLLWLPRAWLDHPRRRRLRGEGRARARPPLLPRQLRGRAAVRQTTSTTRPSSTAGAAARTSGCTAQPGRRSPSAWRRSASGCARSPRRCPQPTAAGSRVPPQPYLRFDRNDYSLDPHLLGRRVEARAGQRAIAAVASTPARSSPAIGAPSPAGSPSPIRPSSGRSRSFAASADGAESPRSRSARSPATTP